MERGYVQVYTGDGKGKTTALLGLALRATGAGLRVYIGQFIKSSEYSEIKAIRKYLPETVVEQYGSGSHFVRKPSGKDIEAAGAGLKKAAVAVGSGQYDLVLLDELNMAVHYGLVSLEDALALIRQKPPGVELVLTGRNAAPEIVAAADLVSEVRAVKHYYAQGVNARDGIEK